MADDNLIQIDSSTTLELGYHILKTALTNAVGHVNRDSKGLTQAQIAKYYDDIIPRLLTDNKRDENLSPKIRFFEMLDNLSPEKMEEMATSRGEPDRTLIRDLRRGLIASWPTTREFLKPKVGLPSEFDSCILIFRDITRYSGLRIVLEEKLGEILMELPSNPGNEVFAKCMQFYSAFSEAFRTRNINVTEIKNVIINTSRELSTLPQENELDKRKFINTLIDIYEAFSIGGNNPYEPAFTDADKNEARAAINDCIALSIKNKLRHKLESLKTLIGPKYAALSARLNQINNNESFREYVNHILASINGDPNTELNKALLKTLNLDGEFNFNKIKNPGVDSPITYLTVSITNFTIEKQLKKYEENGKSGIINALSDFWNRIDNPLRRDIEILNRVRNDLPNPRQPESIKYDNFTNLLTRESAEVKSDSSPLKLLLLNTQTYLAETFNKTFGQSHQYSVNVALERNACHNELMALEFEKYAANRGTESKLKSIVKVGFFKTINELIFNNRKEKDDRVRDAEYFARSIRKCTTAQDYMNFILEACSTINKINKEGNGDSSGLKELLISMINLIITDNILNGHLPPFTKEQLFEIYMSNVATREPGIAKQFKENKLIKNIRASQIDKVVFINPENETLAKLQAKLVRTLGKKHFGELAIKYMGESDPIAEDPNLVAAKGRVEARLIDMRIENTAGAINLFRKTIEEKLLAHLLASKIISSGRVTAASGSEAAIGGKIANLGGLFGAVPGVGEGFKVIGELMKMDDDRRRNIENNNIAAVATDLAFIHKLVKAVALKAAYRYCQQIDMVNPAKVIEFAEYAIERMIRYIESGNIDMSTIRDPATDLTKYADLLLNAIKTNRIGHSFVPFVKTSIPGRNDEEYNVEDLFSSTGIVIVTNGHIQLFSKNGEEPRHGYVVGDIKEVQYYSMQPVPKENPTHQVQSLSAEMQNEMREQLNTNNPVVGFNDPFKQIKSDANNEAKTQNLEARVNDLENKLVKYKEKVIKRVELLEKANQALVDTITRQQSLYHDLIVMANSNGFVIPDHVKMNLMPPIVKITSTKVTDKVKQLEEQQDELQKRSAITDARIKELFELLQSEKAKKSEAPSITPPPSVTST